MDFIYFIIALLVVLSVHEASHALMAYYLGDPTAKLQGRLSLNPIRHLDLMGSIVFLVTQSIGWGKPVPINPLNFRRPVRDSALSALAGPLSNFILAFLIALPLRYLGVYMPDFVATILWSIFHVSIFLGIFNLFPFPPLDGSKIIGLFVPKKWYYEYGNYLNNGTKYFLVAILVDSFVLAPVFHFSIFVSVMSYLHEIVSMVLLLGM